MILLRSSFLRPFYAAVLALCCAAVAVTWASLRERPDLMAGDAAAYLSIAKDLADTGVFTDGRFQGAGIANGPHGEGMFFAPLYPAFVAASMTIDARLYDNVACHLDLPVRTDCSSDMGVLRGVQICLAIMATFLVWVSGYLLSGRIAVAWVAMGLAHLTRVYTYYTADVMTGGLLFPLFSLTMVLGLYAWQSRKLYVWFLCGCCLGLTALVRPSFPYLFYTVLPVLAVVFYVREGRRFKLALRVPALFAIGYILVVAPWIVRNGVVLGEYALSGGYSSYILVQRVSYNRMTPQEWAYSFVYTLPDFGDRLAESLFGEGCCQRLTYSDPNGFYEVGNNALRQETLAKAGSVKAHFGYLLRHEVIANFPKHLAVTLSLAWKGMWVQKYWGLVTIPLFCVVAWQAVRQRWGAFLLFSFSPWFMLGFHAFTTVNVVRYNFLLIPCLSVAAAILITRWGDAVWRRVIKRESYPDVA